MWRVRIAALGCAVHTADCKCRIALFYRFYALAKDITIHATLRQVGHRVGDGGSYCVRIAGISAPVLAGRSLCYVRILVCVLCTYVVFGTLFASLVAYVCF